MSTTKRTVIYRKATVIDGTDHSSSSRLQDLYRKAMESENITHPLLYKSKGGETILLHSLKSSPHTYSREGCTCGCISVYDDETKIPLIDKEYEDNEIFTQLIDPKDKENKTRKFEKQVHIFAIQDDHVAILSTALHGATIVERSLNYVIFECAKLIDAGEVHLQNVPSSEISDKIRGKNIKKLTLTGNPYVTIEEKMTEQEIKMAKKETPKRRKFIKKTRTETILGKIMNLLKTENIITSIDDIKDSSTRGMSMALEFACNTRTADETKELVNEIALNFESIDNLNTKITYDDETVIQGDQLTVKGTVTLDVQPSGSTKAKVMSAVAKWLNSKIQEGHVES